MATQIFRNSWFVPFNRDTFANWPARLPKWLHFPNARQQIVQNYSTQKRYFVGLLGAENVFRLVLVDLCQIILCKNHQTGIFPKKIHRRRRLDKFIFKVLLNLFLAFCNTQISEVHFCMVKRRLHNIPSCHAKFQKETIDFLHKNRLRCFVKMLWSTDI